MREQACALPRARVLPNTCEDLPVLEEGKLRFAGLRDSSGGIASWIGSIPSAAKAALDVFLTAGLKPAPSKQEAG